MIVVNKSGLPIYISETNTTILPNGTQYILPDMIAYRYRNQLDFIDERAFADPRFIDINKRLNYLEEQNNGLIRYGKTLSNFILNSVQKKETDPLDFIYIFQFKKEDIPQALQRLNISIRSIMNQKVNIKLCNISETDISNFTQNFNITYKHLPIFNAGIHNRSLMINTAVKELVKTEYFFISDIDLIYPPTFIQSITSLIPMAVKPIRVIFYNVNLGPGRYTLDINQLKQMFNANPDRERASPGIAGGNGLIHKHSFELIEGFDQRYQAYGPEDQDFNMRIRYLNDVIVLDNDLVNTYHIYHPLNQKGGVNNNKLFDAVKKILLNINTETFNPQKDINLIKAGYINS